MDKLKHKLESTFSHDPTSTSSTVQHQDGSASAAGGSSWTCGTEGAQQDQPTTSASSDPQEYRESQGEGETEGGAHYQYGEPRTTEQAKREGERYMENFDL
ncbi:hypothetical protein G7K_1833-t1 [Saitoella complicata NRRL Y-17804]|uniref:Uncharacterized protein n=1 Tax=Saitoella complicata (strain BCRC 22490 / CBS 7301 / JCM 7358 / NBRC 10748 / NRRL Y-17804) TaxID=698492 RepID=A0A0E9NCV7_SAICN|nr:hypothetical protein G7K_1833-t1 [Saitoella complicata NRRL Y-17804]